MVGNPVVFVFQFSPFSGFLAFFYFYKILNEILFFFFEFLLVAEIIEHFQQSFTIIVKMLWSKKIKSKALLFAWTFVVISIVFIEQDITVASVIHVEFIRLFLVINCHPIL